MPFWEFYCIEISVAIARCSFSVTAEYQSLIIAYREQPDTRLYYPSRFIVIRNYQRNGSRGDFLGPEPFYCYPPPPLFTFNLLGGTSARLSQHERDLPELFASLMVNTLDWSCRVTKGRHHDPLADSGAHSEG